jgi:two-component SAPR family response regulator
VSELLDYSLEGAAKTRKGNSLLSHAMIFNGNKKNAALRISTLGGFRVLRDGIEVKPTAWGREKAIYLFQYLVTNRNKQQHKEQIIAQLWPELNQEAGDRDFKVALNSINKAIEPERSPRSQPRFIRRFDLAYGLNLGQIWIDVDDFEIKIEGANQLVASDLTSAIDSYQAALDLYKGEYLPERRYEDWSSGERERLRLIAMSAITALAELQIDSNPRDSLRLAQQVLSQEPLWEEAYRIQMLAFQTLGNRPMAIKTYLQCEKKLDDEYGIEPLPETQSIYDEIRGQA